LARKVPRRGSFRNLKELTEADEDFQGISNNSAKPRAWRKREVKGDPARNAIMNLSD
jgi:hypothetical protein